MLTVRMDSVPDLTTENNELPPEGRGESEPSLCQVMVLLSELVSQERLKEALALTLKRDAGKSVTFGNVTATAASESVSSSG